MDALTAWLGGLVGGFACGAFVTRAVWARLAAEAKLREWARGYREGWNECKATREMGKEEG